MIELSVIVVSWNVADLLAACLQSILDSPFAPSTEILVVDSGSSDATAAMLAQRFPTVRVLWQQDNVGFTRGNNLGLRAAQGRWLLLLNPDTKILGDALGQMARYLDAHPDVGIVGPHTLNPDDSTQSTRRRFPTLRLALFESTWLQAYAPKAWLDRFYCADQPDDTATHEVDWVQGSALMARREVYAKIGGLDEGYVMYSEELDWCRRAKEAGWRVVYLGAATIIHYGGQSSAQAAARTQIEFQRSKLRYFRKFHGAAASTLLRADLLLQYLWQLGLEAAKGALGSKRELRRERVRAYWSVLRSGLKAG